MKKPLALALLPLLYLLPSVLVFSSAQGREAAANGPVAELLTLNPTATDPVTLRSTITVGDPCHDLKKMNVRVQHSKRRVRVDLRYDKVWANCLAVEVERTQEVTVGPLVEGEWELVVRWYYHGEKVTTQTLPLTVAP